jgi:hypothetical protein
LFALIFSERLPGWTGAIAWSAYPEQQGKYAPNNKSRGKSGGVQKNPNRSVLGAATVPDTVFVLMSADNGMLYLWAVEGMDAETAPTFSHPQHKSKKEPKEPVTVLVGIVELPVKVSALSNIVSTLLICNCNL